MQGISISISKWILEVTSQHNAMILFLRDQRFSAADVSQGEKPTTNATQNGAVPGFRTRFSVLKNGT